MRPAISPPSDPGFVKHKAHGEIAQLELLRQVVKLCKGKHVALDVGAHIGLWSRNLAPHFENVLAFEPIKENQETFRKNVEGLTNVWLADFALGDRRANVGFKLPEKGNSGMWHVDTVGEGEPNMHTLNSLPLNGCDLIKIDAEGFEGRVIAGGIETIARYSPVIVFEDNGLGQKYYGAGWIDPTHALRALDYKLRFTWRKDQVWLPA